MRLGVFAISLVAMSAMGAVVQLPSASAAETYPNRPIRLIVGFPPGGAADILGRIVAQQLGDALGQQMIKADFAKWAKVVKDSGARVD